MFCTNSLPRTETITCLSPIKAIKTLHKQEKSILNFNFNEDVNNPGVCRAVMGLHPLTLHQHSGGKHRGGFWLVGITKTEPYTRQIVRVLDGQSAGTYQNL